LYRRKNCWFNEQLTAAEYDKRLSEFEGFSATEKARVLEDFYSVRRNAAHLGIHQFRCENSIGQHLSECADCYQCYESFALEDCIYNIECNGNKNSIDLTVCFETEDSCCCIQSPLNKSCSFLMHTDYCGYSEFCAYSKNLVDCFGCVYLANKRYHILNKPYSKEDYEKQVAEIKRQLIANGDYNLLLYFVSDYEKTRIETEEDKVLNVGTQEFKWETTRMKSEGKSQELTCKNPDCSKDFLVIPQEISIYQARNIPAPDFCPACRHKQRMALRNEREMYRRSCDNCRSSMLSTYPQDAPYKVFCQKCFWENID
jgi:hypothetical protein